ncbi:SDR family oxidoreductase [Nocardioides daejeonensis]|uniref:SDR family oxidoreductase n=1 Tax=Nocardioides daejeonensis TaxID=1046556 RepID=UPI000D74513D|nr:NAD(P)H-binding protein [Nocardioides daejeonensis]
MTRIAVAGGTGEVGARVMARGAERGFDMVSLSRASGIDLMSAAGLVDLLGDVDVVIDCLSISTVRRGPAMRFFATTTRNLLAAGAEAGVKHHLALSIVGVDQVPYAYYQAKLAQERAITDSGAPWTLLRATQFHEFAAQMAQRSAIGPFVLAPRMLSAPIAADEVADTLLDLAGAEPRRSIVEVGGPERRQMVDMVREWLAATGSRKRVIPVPMPGAGEAARSGALCPVAPMRTGTLTFADWLSTQR